MGHLQATDAQWAALGAHAKRPGTVTMLNLLKFRDAADYSQHPDEPARTGRDAYAFYAAHALPIVSSYGGRTVFSGNLAETIIGPTGLEWDQVLLVEYPRVATFMEMVQSAEYRAISHHRTAALEDSRLVPIFGT